MYFYLFYSVNHRTSNEAFIIVEFIYFIWLGCSLVLACSVGAGELISDCILHTVAVAGGRGMCVCEVGRSAPHHRLCDWTVHIVSLLWYPRT